MDQAFIGIFLGIDPTGRQDAKREDIKKAVKDRFILIQHKFKQQSLLDDGGYAYDGNRCLPENLGWRFIQSHGLRSPCDIESGTLDGLIEETWHESARAEHWYRYEKDWGL